MYLQPYGCTLRPPHPAGKARAAAGPVADAVLSRVGARAYGADMGRIVFDTATSLNGWIADEDNSLAWLFAVDNGDAPDDALFPSGASVLVEGSTTYEWLLAEEDVLAHPERWRAFHGDRPTFVFTSRDLPVPDGADVRFVSGPVEQALPAIREAAGDGDVWVVGGGDLAGQFLDVGALDEIALSVAPVALTGGAPLLPRRLESDRLRLVSTEAVGQFARLVYRVLPATGAGPAAPGGPAGGAT